MIETLSIRRIYWRHNTTLCLVFFNVFHINLVCLCMLVTYDTASTSSLLSHFLFINIINEVYLQISVAKHGIPWETWCCTVMCRIHLKTIAYLSLERSYNSFLDYGSKRLSTRFAHVDSPYHWFPLHLPNCSICPLMVDLFPLTLKRHLRNRISTLSCAVEG